MLLRHVARGGMGEIYLASAGGIEGAERPCIVKIIRREHADDKSFLARFFDEARIQAQLQHPGVVQVHEADIDEDGKPYVVLEYVEGRNLSEVRHRAQQLKVRIHWSEAVALGVLLAEGLVHVHECSDSTGRPLGIVHRDLSPQNVMVGYGGDVKMIDFGTARGENRRCRTVSGIVFAKPGYVAPEVANETPGGAPADIYAFGVMLWELIAGRRFLSGEASEHMAAVGSGNRSPTPLAQLVGAPRDLDRIIARATALRIEDRYGRAREALADLARLMKGAPSLADGERGVRARVQYLMSRLHPAEPARSRAEFARLVARARERKPQAPVFAKTPTPPPTRLLENELLPGTRYKVLGELGRGAMGVVYEAFHVDLGRTVALKVLSEERASSKKFEARFRTEARAISKLDHENIVKLHDFGVTSDGRPFYAMELLEGETLERHLERERGMDWREAVLHAIDVCRALEAAHAVGLVHRDIKPANLFLVADGGMKLLDFGVAKALTDVDTDEETSRSGALSFVGTPEYLAPEQATGEAVDERTDLYSLGAVLYELVTGRLPHVAKSTVALLDAKSRIDPEPARQRAPQRGIAKMLEETIQRSLARDPEARFQTAAEMREALERALREPVRRRARRRAIAAAALALALVAGAGGSVVAFRHPEVRARAEKMTRPFLERLGVHTAAGMAPSRVAAGVVTPAAAEETKPVAVLEESPKPTQSAGEGALPVDDSEKADPGQAPAPSDPGERAEGPAPQADQSDEAGFFAAVPTHGAGESGGDDVDTRLASARELMNKGASIKAFNLFRKIGKSHRRDPRALRAWSEAAAKMKAWGEALRVAKQWAGVDQSAQARIHLARMQRIVGQTSASVETLSRLLDDHPRCDEARALLRKYSGSRIALNR